MTLDDLRTGDIVEFRNGKHGIVMPSENADDIGPYEFFPFGGDFADFNVNMNHGSGHNVCDEFDVMKVCKSSEPWSGCACAIIDMCVNENLKTSGVEWHWEREKEEDLLKEKLKVYKELAELKIQIQRVNKKLKALEKHEKAIELMIKIAKSIEWNEWELEDVLKGVNNNGN